MKLQTKRAPGTSALEWDLDFGLFAFCEASADNAQLFDFFCQTVFKTYESKLLDSLAIHKFIREIFSGRTSLCNGEKSVIKWNLIEPDREVGQFSASAGANQVNTVLTAPTEVAPKQPTTPRSSQPAKSGEAPEPAPPKKRRIAETELNPVNKTAVSFSPKNCNNRPHTHTYD
jgi:hypothetical protein